MYCLLFRSFCRRLLFLYAYFVFPFPTHERAYQAINDIFSQGTATNRQLGDCALVKLSHPLIDGCMCTLGYSVNLISLTIFGRWLNIHVDVWGAHTDTLTDDWDARARQRVLSIVRQHIESIQMSTRIDSVPRLATFPCLSPLNGRDCFVNCL